jgi:hypothetical protein
MYPMTSENSLIMYYYLIILIKNIIKVNYRGRGDCNSSINVLKICIVIE